MQSAENKVGDIVWVDMTVPNASGVRDFYKAVVGWDVSELDMGGYSDYCMNRADDQKTVAGICHARGVNAGLPPQWLIYIKVADLDASVAAVTAKGGQVLTGPKPIGSSRYCVMRDPAGAVAALIQE